MSTKNSSDGSPPASLDELFGQLKAYITRAAPCPYLPNLTEQRLLVPLTTNPAGAQEQLSFFTRLGFRRSQNIMYRPQCPSCQRCVSYRVQVADFKPSATQARLGRKNRDLFFSELTLHEAAAESYALFTAYQNSRHAGGEMAKFTQSEFQQLLLDAAPGTTAFSLKHEGTLCAIMLADRTADGLSAVYSYYNPALTSRSLGTELILRLIAQAAREDLAYVYLGYWVQGSPKMEYKKHFRPAEVLTPDGWVSCQI